MPRILSLILIRSSTYLTFRRDQGLRSSSSTPSFEFSTPSSSAAMSEPEHLRMTYNDIHKLIRASAEKIADFKPDMLIAIGASPEICPARPLTEGFPQVEGECHSFLI